MASRLCGLHSLRFDASGNLWVPDHFNNRALSDSSNNRVLVYNPPFTTHQAASVVIGQPNFYSNAPNNGGGTGADGLNFNRGITFDLAVNLWVADTDNNRVVMFPAPLTTYELATIVLGQPNFTFNAYTDGDGSATATGLCHPIGLGFDGSGNLWVADSDNERVLMYPNLT